VTQVTAFDPDFLSVRAPLPVVPSGLPVRELPFTHFTVLLEPGRRLAVATGVNVDGAQLLDLDRGDDWHLDPRVPSEEQTGPEVYADNDLDRGHLVRRRDPVWGDAETAAQANLDSFTYVNAAPQAALFNQGELLWAGLENYILDHARVNGQRLSVFTAPVLAPDDPPYRGIQVPRRFWKIAAWATAGPGDGAAGLAATGYVLDQSEVLDPLLQSSAEPPPLGAYLTYQVPLVDIATLTGLDLGPLPAADRLPSPAPVPAGDLSSTVLSERWLLLHRSSDMRL
jgi:endonuclease G